MAYWVEEHDREYEDHTYNYKGDVIQFTRKKLYGPFRTYNDLQDYLSHGNADKKYTVWDYD